MKRKCLAILAAFVVMAAPAGAQRGRDSATLKFQMAEWSYEYSVGGLGSKSQAETGELRYGDKTLDAKSIKDLHVNDYMHSPLGTLYWWGPRKFAFGGHGWLAHPKTSAAKGTRLTPPDASPGRVFLSAADQGTTVAIATGNYLDIRLPTLDAGERIWVVKSGTDDLLQYFPSGPDNARLPGWGSLNKQDLHFRAIKTGKATLVLRNGVESGKEWKVSVEVREK